MSNKAAILFIDNDQEDFFFGKISKDSSLKTSLDELGYKKTNFDSFQSGNKITRYQFVLAYVKHDYEADELEMMEEFYQSFAVAPVFIWVAPESAQGACKNFHEGSIFIACDSDEILVPQVNEAIVKAELKIKSVLEEEIKPAFAKVDKDGSGAIDKSELGELSAGLGQPLDDEKLSQALKDLDINGDGVIDESEFSAWYLSGMAPLNGSQRAYKLMKSRGRNLLKALGDESKKALIGQELKLKQHSIRVGFNAPKENPGFSIKASVYPMGLQHEQTTEKLTNSYSGLVNHKS